jgi:adenosine 3'-phospho 5'-phosphosulfate transporter B2
MQSEQTTVPVDYSLAFWCILYAAGLIGTLVVYGVLQERIMTVPYGEAPNAELFGVSAFLVLSNRIFNSAYATTMIKVNGESLEPKAPIWKYMIISFSNVAATMCQYECLKYVSFPVQMLGKSFKMMPVMIWGMAISGKRFGLRDWIIAGCVTAGVTEFLMTGPTSSPNDKANSIYGFLLLLIFLACDGLTSTMQEKLFKEHNTSKFNQMLYVNGCSAITSLFTVVASGKLFFCFNFVGAHGTFVLDALILSVAAATSQYFIYSQVKEFGALVFAATMNVRQVVSILVSYATYHHVLTLLQGIGLFLVFGALGYKSYMGLMHPSKAKDEKVPLQKSTSEPSEAYAATKPREKAEP